MTEPDPASKRRVGGSPTFVVAHGIKDNTDLSFEDAYALAKLVLEEGGGPVPSRSKKAPITRATEKALVQLGLVQVDAWADFHQRVYIEAITDVRLTQLLDARFADVRIRPVSTTQRHRWSVVATQAAFDLVQTHLPA